MTMSPSTMSLTLAIASAAQVEALRVDAISIDDLRYQPGRSNWVTYYPRSITYFLCGDPCPEPDPANPLTCMLAGVETIPYAFLATDGIGVLDPGVVRAIATALPSVDRAALATSVEEADPFELKESAVDDFEVLGDADDPAAELVMSVVTLADFYAGAVSSGSFVVVVAQADARRTEAAFWRHDAERRKRRMAAPGEGRPSGASLW